MLAHEVHGSPGHPPLCFLHGFMGHQGGWSEIIEAMAENYFCLTVDLPGHGQSLKQPSEFYSMEGTAQALVNVFDEAGFEQTTLVGYSMGGRVALYVSLTMTSRVDRLVLESVSPGLRTEEERADRREVDALRAERIERDLDTFLQEWYRLPLFASLKRHDLVEEMIATRRENEPSELARALRGLSPGRQPSLWERLDELEIPALLLTGALDAKYESITEQTAARIRSARRVVVPGAGHNVHAERPQAFLGELRQFLEATS